MKKYDENSTCPKCGGGRVRSVFETGHEYYRCRDTLNREEDVEAKHDRIKRTCERCYFEWNEQSLEKEDKG